MLDTVYTDDESFLLYGKWYAFLNSRCLQARTMSHGPWLAHKIAAYENMTNQYHALFVRSAQFKPLSK